MSEWEIVEENKPMKSNSDWEMVNNEPNSRQPQNETFGQAAGKAIPRIGEDIYRGGMNFLKSLPGYAQAAKTEVPGLLQTLQAHPGHALGQGVAGLAELGQNVFNMPHDLVNYATNRLNLIPQSVNQKVQMARMPSDTEDMINQTFGKPQYAGEDLARGLGRNAEAILGGAGLANALNPMRLTNRGIARNVLAEQDRQIANHSTMYNNLWRDAERAGINNVPVSQNLIDTNLDFIRQYKSPRDYRTLEYFSEHPTLQNAQSAVSDLRSMQRALDEKSRTTSLSGEERNLHDALSHTQTHIENNMFLNPDGTLNQPLANRYRQISNSYRENVVPYRYNKAIQAYVNREMTAKELVNSLSRGEFAAKKGSSHPAIGIRNFLKPSWNKVGVGGLLGLIYQNMMGTHPAEQ